MRGEGAPPPTLSLPILLSSDGRKIAERKKKKVFSAIGNFQKRNFKPDLFSISSRPRLLFPPPPKKKKMRKSGAPFCIPPLPSSLCFYLRCVSLTSPLPPPPSPGHPQRPQNISPLGTEERRRKWVAEGVRFRFCMFCARRGGSTFFSPSFRPSPKRFQREIAAPARYAHTHCRIREALSFSVLLGKNISLFLSPHTITISSPRFSRFPPKQLPSNSKDRKTIGEGRGETFP